LGPCGQNLAIAIECRLIETDKNYVPHGKLALQKTHCLLDRNISGPFAWNTITFRTDGWKSYCGDSIPNRKQKYGVAGSAQNRQDNPAL